MKKIFIIALIFFNSLNIFCDNLNFYISKNSGLIISHTDRKNKLSYKKDEINFTFKNKDFILGNINTKGIIKLSNYDRISCSSSELYAKPQIVPFFYSTKLGVSLNIKNFNLYEFQNIDKREFGITFSSNRDRKIFVDLAYIYFKSLEDKKKDDYYYNQNYLKFQNSSKIIFSTTYNLEHLKLKTFLFYSKTNFNHRGIAFINSLNYKDVLFNFNFSIAYFSKHYVVDINKSSKNILNSSISLNIAPIKSLNLLSMLELNIPKFENIIYNYPFSISILNSIDYKHKYINFILKNSYKVEKSINGKYSSQNSFSVALNNSIKIDKTVRYYWEIKSKTNSENIIFKNSSIKILQAFAINRVNFYFGYEYDSLNIHSISYKLTLPFDSIRISVKSALVIKNSSNSLKATLSILI